MMFGRKKPLQVWQYNRFIELNSLSLSRVYSRIIRSKYMLGTAFRAFWVAFWNLGGVESEKMYNEHKKSSRPEMTSRKTKEANCAMESMPMNRSLGAAKAAKQDEFYTQYVDIQKEVEAYLEFDPDTFRGKVVYCNCDDPFESNFFKYFAANFNKLGLKKLVTTSYDGSPIAGAQLCSREYNEGNGKRQKPKAIAVETRASEGCRRRRRDRHRRRQALPEAERPPHPHAASQVPRRRLPQRRVRRVAQAGGHRRHQPALLPLPRVRRPARGAREEVPDHR